MIMPTDACKQGSKKGFAVRDTSKDFCKRLTNIQPQGSVMSGSSTVLHAPRKEVGYEDVAFLPPPEATNMEHSQVPTVMYHHGVSRVDHLLGMTPSILYLHSALLEMTDYAGY